MDVLHRELHDRVQHYIHLLLHDANDKQPADQFFIVLFVSMQSVSHCNAVRKVDKGSEATTLCTDGGRNRVFASLEYCVLLPKMLFFLLQFTQTFSKSRRCEMLPESFHSYA